MTVSFVLNAVYLSGCLQPPMRPLALYKVEVKTLARGLESRSGIEPLVIDELPIAWHFGISGMCTPINLNISSPLPFIIILATDTNITTRRLR